MYMCTLPPYMHHEHIFSQRFVPNPYDPRLGPITPHNKDQGYGTR